jgi:hypothetical protein
MAAIFNRLEIFKSLKNTFKEIIPAIYYTDRPNSTVEQKDSFMVIRGGDMEDLHAYGETYVNLMIFQKDVNNLENTLALDNLQKGIVDKLPINNDLFYTEHPQLIPSKSDGDGFHYLTIYLGLTIK